MRAPQTPASGRRAAVPPGPPFTCVAPACDVAGGGRPPRPLARERQARRQDAAAQAGTLPVPSQPDQGDVAVAAVHAVLWVHDDLLDPELLLELLRHQRVVIPDADGVALRAGAEPGGQGPSGPLHRSPRVPAPRPRTPSVSVASPSCLARRYAPHPPDLSPLTCPVPSSQSHSAPGDFLLSCKVSQCCFALICPNVRSGVLRSPPAWR